MKLSTTNNSNGFTLIEILVVLVLVMVLGALMITGYSHAIKITENQECIGKIRQLGMATIRYAYDHGGRMPSSEWKQPNGRSRSGSVGNFKVKGGILDYLTEWKDPASPAPTEIAWCPTDRRKHNKPINNWQSYGLNSYAKGTMESYDDGTDATPGTFILPPVAAVPEPAMMAMFMDSVKPHITANQVSYPATLGPTTFSNKQDSFYAHDHHLNVVFMDVHVESVPREWVRSQAFPASYFWSGGLLGNP